MPSPLSPPLAPAALAMPPRTRTAEDAPRRVGVELEMSGIGLDALAHIVARRFGLAVEADGRYERRLTGDAAGDWKVELDFDLLKRMGREERDPDTLRGEIGRSAEEALAHIAVWTPVEIVSPPLPLDRLREVEDLVPHLRRAGARGTSDALINAFGTQFNPEAAALDAGYLVAVLKAYLCLHDWLVARSPINLSRRMTRFVDPFPRAYVQRVVDPAYAPDREGLIGDYLHWNATRNRALDLLPLLAHLAPERVAAAVHDDRVKARPAFHYRLPDCDIHRPNWSLAEAWNGWVAVERLAADEARLAGCTQAYHRHLSTPVERWLTDWAEEVERAWLDR
jgi:hypothetical protein